MLLGGYPKSIKQTPLVLEMMMKSSFMILEMMMKTLMTSKLNSMYCVPSILRIVLHWDLVYLLSLRVKLHLVC
uniref:Uncharacterized protein n=1 Tax=Castor canadensis TaxID=51338 RepID=A0A8C0WKV3_CASCN